MRKGDDVVVGEIVEFNPIDTARSLENAYREYYTSTIRFDNDDLQKQLESIARDSGYLSKGPFLEATPPYKVGKSVRDLVAEGLLCKSILSLGGGDPERFDPDRPLYVHQQRAIEKAVHDKNYVVATGTGSGKTESFLLPIINDILQEFEQEDITPGVRALILYPMNALANDQMGRLRTLLGGTPITFGRYTGDTEDDPKKALASWIDEVSRNEGSSRKEPPKNEILSRKEMREAPPHILLTNYSMLEYLLLRPEDDPFFGSAFGRHWRHLAIDEAHVYTGTLGTEIALLLRRLKARIASETGVVPKLHCYATSATMGGPDDASKIAQFAENLFGEPFTGVGKDMDVIRGEADPVTKELSSKPWGVLDLHAWDELRIALSRYEGSELSEELQSIIGRYAGSACAKQLSHAETPELGLGSVLLGELSAAALVKAVSTSPFDLSGADAISDLGIDGLSGNPESERILSSIVEVLSHAQRSRGLPVLSTRYHFFLRAPEGVFVNLATRRLFGVKLVSQDMNGITVPVYEIAACRHCGQAYILGRGESFSDGSGCQWLNPRHQGTDADEEFVPREYFRLMPEGEGIDTEGEEELWLCPLCGSLHDALEGGCHRFAHEEVPRVRIARSSTGDQTEHEAKCHHCNYQSPIAIQSARVSGEAVGSLACSLLARQIPPFEGKEDLPEDDPFASFGQDESNRRPGSIICFSDNRQDAAFLAASMDSTTTTFSHRQLVRHAVDACSRGSRGCLPSAIVDWIVERSQEGFFDSKPDHRVQAEAWVVDDLADDASRISLEGLGLIRIEPTVFIEEMRSEGGGRAVAWYLDKKLSGNPWLTVDDFSLFCRICLDSLRKDGALIVSDGVERCRRNHQKKTRSFVVDDNIAAKEEIRFAGTFGASSENNRSNFVRRYAKKIYGIDVSREDAYNILFCVGEFTVGLFKKSKKLRGLIEEKDRRHAFYPDAWMMYPHTNSDKVYRCDMCGCLTHVDSRGVCQTRNCHGTLHAMTYAEAEKIDRYYKKLYCEDALPIVVEEHTAQLSRDRAAEIQSEFIKGKVNILSCTTTFELGVDVGDLRAVYLSNVPPSPANYAQRAGRVGRRAGKPGFVITFCRLRPHDRACFDDPLREISGKTAVPLCYLNNERIALRHVFAIALSAYFRHREALGFGVDESHRFNAFLSLADDSPTGLRNLDEYLSGRPHEVEQQLRQVFGVGSGFASMLEVVNTWSWVDKLLAPMEGDESGRLTLVHSIKRDDYRRVEEELHRTHDHKKIGNLNHLLGELDEQRTISVLAEGGVLPKYGFPTDIVELDMPGQNRYLNGTKKLQLQRGLRLAVREYAPGSRVVADKRLWKSTGVKILRGRKLIYRMYGLCSNPDCKTFVWPIDNLGDESKIPCPVCGTEIKLKRKMVEPIFGFVGEEVKSGVGLRRPRSKGFAYTYFSQDWPGGAVGDELLLPGGVIETKFASNGELCVINENGRAGYWMCSVCGRTAGDRLDKKFHGDGCVKCNKQPDTYINAIGASFRSDVLQLVFRFDGAGEVDDDAWESAMWALLASASDILDIPGSEIGGTMYDIRGGGKALMLYDNVPGGAGHVERLRDNLRELLEAAYCRVTTCSCGEDTCCYGCIGSYYNQSRQAHLSRGAATRILGMLLNRKGECGIPCQSQDDPSREIADRASRGFSKVSPSAAPLDLCAYFDGPDLDGSGFSGACKLALSRCSNEEERTYLLTLAELGSDMGFEIPMIDVTFYDVDGNEAEATLAWRNARVALLNGESCDEFTDVFGKSAPIEGWRVFRMSDSQPQVVIEAVGGGAR